MKKPRLLAVCGILAVVACGCIWPFSSQPSTEAVLEEPTIVGRILDREALRRSAVLYVQTFRPGPDVVATEELESFSQSVKEGIIQAVQDTEGRLTVEDADRSRADIIIAGHVTQYAKEASIPMVTRRKWLNVTIDAVVKDAGTQTPLVLLFPEDTYSLVEQEIPAIGRNVGYALGQFIAIHAR